MWKLSLLNDFIRNFVTPDVTNAFYILLIQFSLPNATMLVCGVTLQYDHISYSLVQMVPVNDIHIYTANLKELYFLKN